MAIPFLACMIATAHAYHLPPRVLPAIQRVEGGQVGTISPNTDGSADFGVMQVNSRWIAPISSITGITPENVRIRLIYDPCFSIAAAGAIMRVYLDESRGDLLTAVGYYHSHTPGLGDAYKMRVIGAATAMFGGRQRPGSE